MKPSGYATRAPRIYHICGYLISIPAKCRRENFDAMKLSKRKLKALAFRGKTDGKQSDGVRPAIEKAEIASSEDFEHEKRRSQSRNHGTKVNSRKRKRDNDEPPISQDIPQRLPKKVKKSQSKSSAHSKQGGDEDAQHTLNSDVTTKKKDPDGKRYILFVGNLPHKPSTDLLPALQSHFPAAPISIRIPTKRETNAPQGFAFLEFDSAQALEKALRCHHTVLLGRKINVELTAGGGGRGETRMKKIKVRNEHLLEERKKRIAEEKDKEGKSKNESPDVGIHPDRLKRIQRK